MDNSGGDGRRRTQRLFRIHERRGGFEGRTKNHTKSEGGEEEKIRKRGAGEKHQCLQYKEDDNLALGRRKYICLQKYTG